MALFIKCLPDECEDLSLDPLHPHKEARHGSVFLKPRWVEETSTGEVETGR